MRIKTPLFYIQVDIIIIIFLFFVLIFKSVRDVFSSYLICYLFIVFHEASHVFVASILGEVIDTFYIRLCGVSVSFKKERFTTKTKDKKEKKYLIKQILIYVAGPISNMSLALIFNKIKLVFEINMFLGILNLIPIFPLDGYNILKNILIMRFSNNIVNKILKIINLFLLIIMSFLAIILLIFDLNPCFMFFIIYVIILTSFKA